MPSSTYFFTKFASIIYRLGNRYYDRELARHQIGCGQQFFLLRIYENEGISMYDLAKTGYYDKGTVTRAIQKLEELSLIRCQVDEADRRIRHLYTTPAARPIVENLYETRQKWNRILTAGMTEQEADEAQRLLGKMAGNAYNYIYGQEEHAHE